MKKILLVEDDEALAYGIDIALQSNNYDVTISKFILDGKKTFNNQVFDLVILDIDLPDGSGYDLCKYIRMGSDVPIIFLTGLSEELNVVTGLDMGADDYITKPFTLSVLISRMNAIFRRIDKKSYSVLVSNDIYFYLNEVRLTKDNENIPISITEYKLLKLLLENSLRIVTKEQILTHVWDDAENYVDENAIAVNIKRIRAKIEDDKSRPEYIKTIRGLGYTWNQRCEKR
ncbi:DNA-binding response regulator [Vallitalea longa]|uniref:Stage 0 sporulation protein A homolog n=1 Tax=Vallitalea longa TaxID=2936439 RepID=A0A9W5YFD8_9FIRM|nr:response regulator transcription factor [Vallitalea longa]GKX31298.1 DNA-binding response regulator [Vallitalea longa]